MVLDTYKIKSILLFLVLLSTTAKAQIKIEGIVLENNIAVENSTIVLDNKMFQLSNQQGYFIFNNIKKGKHTIKVEMIGFKTFVQELNVNNKNINLNINLKANTNFLSDVVIYADRPKEKLKKTGYAVDVIETQELKNLSADINQILKTTPGVNLRESGGVGSNFKLSLNGLSGNQIRYFIDGVPMENFGSSMTLNNFPINLIETIKIYKGVVPIHLGNDALGGAININTAFRKTSFLDVSYSLGSFNTHKTTLNTQYVNKNRYYLKLLSFFNYSDNDYLMKNVPVFDLELGNNKGVIDVKRFNDQYQSTLISAEIGTFKQKYADKLYFRFSYSDNKKNYQHPDNNLKRALGDFNTNGNTSLFSVLYQKKLNHLKIKLLGLYGTVKQTTDDTSDRKYNWTGNFVTRDNDNLLGELGNKRFLFRLSDNVGNGQLNLGYKFLKYHYLEFNHSLNYLRRIGIDDVNINNRAFSIPTTLTKNISSLAYTMKYKTMNFSLFGKQYFFLAGKEKISDVDTELNVNFSNTGYGAVFSITPISFITIKTSYEKGYRVPESYELLGDGLFIRDNFKLEPEISDNFNLGLRVNKSFSDIRLINDTNLFYRKSKDFIRPSIPQGDVSIYDNIVDVDSKGIESGVKAIYKNFEAQFNVTYQDIIDKQEFDEGFINEAFNDRVPNIPYLFWNSRLGIKLFKDKLGAYWNYNFVESFFLKSEKNGNVEDKNVIPSQSVHGLDFAYTWKDGKYNISASVTNLTDQLVFDNFKIQKPGRAFYMKFRYFLK